MRKLIAAINTTLDGICDHTAGIPDDELHQHYTELLNDADAILYGRITFELMKYWQPLLENPTGIKATDDFAVTIDRIPKIVFSNTLKEADSSAIGWKSATLANRTVEEVVLELKQQSGKDILVGSRSLILQLMDLNLIDEYQFCIHPVVAGGGLPLFEKTNGGVVFNLLKTKTFGSGAILLYYTRKQ